jgi:succinoglycan biosynthesis transport protein ExoP
MAAADLYVSLWRHKLFILVTTSLLAIATWYLTSQKTPIYQASTLIRVQQSVEDARDPIRSLDLGERLARTYAKIVTTRELARRIEDQLDGSVPFEAIRGDVSADPIQDLELLWITARSPEPRVARLIANAAPPALRNFIKEKGTLREQIVTVETAALPRTPASPNLKLNLIVAIMLGLLFNGALALLLEVLSDRLPKHDELEEAVGLPILAIIPALTFARAGGGERVRSWGSTPTEAALSGNGAAAPDEKARRTPSG